MNSSTYSLATVIKKSLISTDNKKITFLNRGEIQNEETLTGVNAHKKILKIAKYIVDKKQFRETTSPPVIIAMSSGLNTVLTINACIYAGVVFMPIQVAKTEESFKKAVKLFNNCGVREVIVDHFGREFIEHLKKEYNLDKNINSILVSDEEINETLPNEKGLEGFAKPLSEYCLIQHTSGSTSDPKAIIITGQSVLNNQKMIEKQWGLNQNSIFCSWLPHYHDMGLFCIIYSIINSRHLIITSTLAFVQKPLRWLKIISHYKVTITGAPPFAYRLIIESFKKKADATIDLSSLLAIFCGAENVPKSLIADFNDTFKNNGLAPNILFNTYGMAEVVSYISGSIAPISKKATTSELLFVAPVFLNPDAYPTVQIVNPETSTIVHKGVEGEIWIQSDFLAVGYFKLLSDGTYTVNREGFNGKLPNKKGEWFKTKDRGIIKGKYLYILGRAKDIIINNGVNFSASEIEVIAANVNETLNPFGAAAFQKTEKDKTSITLLIEFSESRPNLDSLDAITDGIKKAILHHFSINLDNIYFFKRGSLPRTSSGKIKRVYIANNFSFLSYSDKILI
jgi:acyl-CoA synthetase (AMP-forming)/AMP-acid ligase II